ncbi:hypothetical protein L228DRAFT_242942 [Xylona heveae TC161]|uniref:Sas10 C-terminal domain-containing protein n=1 Tax=Xylona heveae (strain CBS 132557 / TC161) TaxID=1328760 RepID=A0A165JNW5_XYLHT|nr:hypothetical protein L228DRAFT_242942 [Xylona heveae TC161]KZF26465.1 hypothetical protein L228DRAFT_242942 [Xylona heveae TC161]
MAKKRKASGRPAGSSGPREVNDADAKLRVNTYEDVADSEDDFHMGRDKILLEEGPNEKRRRKLQEEEKFLQPSDEEVLNYGSSESEPEDDQDDYDEDEGDDVDIANQEARPSKRARRGSDSEGSERAQGDEDIDVGDWGTSKKDYYDADVIDTEAAAIEEEKEARRLQQKRLEAMNEADFGFDESEWLEAGKEDGAQAGEEEDDDKDVVTEVLPRLELTGDMSIEERTNVLKSRYPEFEPLTKEFLELHPLHNDLALMAGAAETIIEHDTSPKRPSKPTKTPAAIIKYQALTAYLGALSMYFALLTSTSRDDKGVVLAMSAEELRDHAIMDTLVRCREVWNKVKDLHIPDPAKLISHEEGISEEELPEEIDESFAVRVNGKVKSADKTKKKKKTKAQRAAEAAQAESEARRAERMRKAEADLADLDALADPKARKRRAAAAAAQAEERKAAEDGEGSDFGDETLTAEEAAEKAKRKKDLRFYTSQIAQKANRRGAATRDAGGDADLPYRERLKDRQTRLNAEAEKRGKKRQEIGADLGGDSDEEDRRAARELRADAAGVKVGADETDDDEYYDMVASRSKQRKDDKKRRAEAYAEAQREGGRVIETEGEIGPDGKRAIGYVIEKNKGLAPKRKKDVRNPRVKKRKKFEDKKKKLNSIRQVYKGGQGGAYGGEATGIKKGLVKSVKL